MVWDRRFQEYSTEDYSKVVPKIEEIIQLEQLEEIKLVVGDISQTLAPNLTIIDSSESEQKKVEIIPSNDVVVKKKRGFQKKAKLPEIQSSQQVSVDEENKSNH